MNYALFADWVRERVEDLVEMGVPRAAAEQTMHYVEITAVNAESKDRQDRQFLIDFVQVGSTVMAERCGKSPQWIRKRRQKLLNERNQNSPERLRAQLR